MAKRDVPMALRPPLLVIRTPPHAGVVCARCTKKRKLHREKAYHINADAVSKCYELAAREEFLKEQARLHETRDQNG